MSAQSIYSDDLVVREFECEPRDVVYVKSVANAYDGLCCLFSEKGGKVRLVAPKGREAELDLLVNDLRDELRGRSSSNSGCLL